MSKEHREKIVIGLINDLKEELMSSYEYASKDLNKS